MTGPVRRSFGLPAARGHGLDAAAAIHLLRSGSILPGMMLGYGNGRSYGDSCLNAGGMLADMRGENHIMVFDRQTGVIEVEAGVLLSDVIAHAAPHGWFPRVLPGTQFVTVGGAIANDIHGKNHHLRGTFGAHVTSLRLLRSDGQTMACSLTEQPELFAATIGGMGLTGLILSATLRLMPVHSLDVMQEVRPFASLDDYLSMAEEADRDNEYAVAWIDQLASGRNAGRGLLLTGNHARYGARALKHATSRLGVPVQPPMAVLNRPFIRVFNAAYRWSKQRQQAPRAVGMQGFFFPLDGVANWNRLYGPRGLRQHQSVVPFETARHALPDLLQAARTAGEASFLTVLKRFGSLKSPGLLSFPRPGYTLTLDFPYRGQRTDRLLDRLDRITIDAGGAVNPYKDAHMSAETFAASFPNWEDLERLRDPGFLSDFWRRTALKLPRRILVREAAE